MIHINTTVLAFYDSVSKQSHRLHYAYNNVFSLLSPTTRLLPFQLIVEKTFPNISTVLLKNIQDSTVKDLTTYFNAEALRKTFTDYDVYIFPGVNYLSPELAEGLYYLEIQANTEKLYSEVFNCVKTIQAAEIVNISYWDNSDFIFQHIPGRIVYSDNYRSKIYLPTKLAKPDYKIEEVVEDRDGFKFVEKQIQKKLYRFSFLATEYLCDVVSMIGMHDNIVITYNGKIYYVYDILFTPEWTNDGFVANVDSEFTTDAIVKKIGRLFPKHNLGDFNSDFNSDFNVI